MRRLSLLAAGALLLSSAAARLDAQTRGSEPARPDSIVLDTSAADTTAFDTAARPRRTPFAVRASGRPEPGRYRREVVWVMPDTTRKDTARADSITVTTETTLEVDTVEAADDAEGPPVRRRTRSARTDAASRDTADADEGKPDPAAKRRAARADSTARARPSSTTTTNRSRADSARATATNRSRARGDSARTASTPTSRTAPASGSGARPRTHTVAAGETLSGIARRYGVTTAQVRALNADVDFGNLQVGEVLRLPAAARTSSQPNRSGTSGSTTATPGGSRSGASRSGGSRTGSAASSRRRTHTVARGETLYGIARRYGVTVDALKRANDMQSDAVRTGQTLVIPASN